MYDLFRKTEKPSVLRSWNLRTVVRSRFKTLRHFIAGKKTKELFHYLYVMEYRCRVQLKDDGTRSIEAAAFESAHVTEQGGSWTQVQVKLIK